MTRMSSKYNDSCLKMFQFLKLLTQGPVDFNVVLDIFSDETTEGKSNPHVALNKYLNTLKIFGIKVQKKQNKYYLLSSPYKINLNADDLTSLNIIKNALELLPNGKHKKNIETFIKNLEIRFSEETQATAKAINSTQNLDYTFNFSELKEQIKQCEEYCQQNHKLEITYTDIKGKLNHIICSPVELKYQKRKICICVNIQNEGRIVEIPIDNIKSINQLPSTNNNQITTTTITFKLKNRLAQNYKLREWERIEKFEPNGDIIVVNKNEDQDLLLRRLMRYGNSCVILYPKFIKERMLELINKTLENYK